MIVFLSVALAVVYLLVAAAVWTFGRAVADDNAPPEDRRRETAHRAALALLWPLALTLLLAAATPIGRRTLLHLANHEPKDPR